MSLPDRHQMQAWAILAAKGATKLEQELGASNLYAAAMAYARELAKAEDQAATRELLMRDLAAQMNSFAQRWGDLDKPTLAAVPEPVQTSGQTPNAFPVRGEEASIPELGLRLIRPVAEPTTAKHAFDAAKGRGE